MLRRTLTTLALLTLLLSTALVALPLYTLYRPLHLNLPLGLSLSSENTGPATRLTFTRWGPESAQWWQTRNRLQPMKVTGQTIAITTNQSVLYASQIHVDMGSTTYANIEARRGATSKTPLTKSAGVMSTPLVPFRSLTMPWFYPLALLLPLPLAYGAHRLLHRHRRLAGTCPHCGYDLRATPTRCPECGHIPRPA